jgi:hypothetical protein
VQSLPFYKATEEDGVITYTDDTYTDQAFPLTSVVPALQAYALVNSVDATAAEKKEYYLKVVRTGMSGPDYIPFDLVQSDNETPFVGPTAGRAFTVTVNYRERDVIKAVAVVSPWEEEGNYTTGVTVGDQKP